MMCTGTCNRAASKRIRNWLLLWAACAFFLFTAAGCEQVVSDAARHRFQNRTEPFTVTVFPVQVIAGNQLDHDEALARRVADFLKSSHLADPRLTSESIKKPAFYHASETRRIRLSARYLTRAVNRMALKTQYAFMAEMVFNSDETRVVGVYYFLADRFGRIASARMANAHHQEFQRINPEDRNDAFQVLIEMLREGWMNHNNLKKAGAI